MTIDLDRLGKLAKAAKQEPRRYLSASYQSGEGIPWLATSADLDFMDAMSPDVVLELIARLKRAESVCQALAKAALLEQDNVGGFREAEAWNVVWELHDEWCNA